jgi:aminobenzoyl-glutamate utilization protein B
VQTNSGQSVTGLRERATPLTGPCEPMMASNDCGDVSWKVPMGRIWFPANIPNAPFHNWAAGAALTTSIAHKGALAGARALAASALDFLLEPARVAEAQRTFDREIAGTSYSPLLPADQKPPLNLNRALMERFRPAMEAHYIEGEPKFV